MSFNQFFMIIKARKLVFWGTWLTIVSFVLVVTSLLPKSYEAQSSLIINYTGLDQVTGGQVPSHMMSGYLGTQIDILKSKKVALKVVKDNELYTNRGFIDTFYGTTGGEGNLEDWIASALLESLEVIPSRDSNVVILKYTSSNPRFSALIVNAFSQSYIDTSLELKIEPSKRATVWFEKQVESMKGDLIKAQSKLSDYQKEKGIVSVDQRYDVENSRLAQLSQQLVVSQADLLNLKSQKEAIDKSGVESSSFELLVEPVVRDIHVSLAKAEIERDELLKRFSSKHPEIISVETEINSLNRRLLVELGMAKRRLNSDVMVAENRVEVLLDEIELQKKKLLEIGENRNMLDLLTRDVSDAKRILDLATQRLNQTSLESKANDIEIAILNEALAPIEPTGPNYISNAILSVFFGLIVAITFALLGELLSRKVRVAEDIEEFVGLPVLVEMKV